MDINVFVALSPRVGLFPTANGAIWELMYFGRAVLQPISVPVAGPSPEII
jgi:hypothetical protein